MYKIIDNNNFKTEKDKYITLVEKVFANDSDKIANILEFEKHLNYIFASPYNNQAFWVLLIVDETLISMVNFFEYDSLNHDWCLFTTFTNKKYRCKGYAGKVLKYGLNYLKRYQYNKLICGIENTNIASIKLHEKNGFVYSGYDWDELAPGFPKNHLGFIYKNFNR